MPDIRIRVINVVDLMTLQSKTEHPHGLNDRDFDALVAGLWTLGQDDLCEPYFDRYLEDAPRVAGRSQSFAADIAFAVPRIPMSLARLESFRDRLEAASAATDSTVLRRGWRDRVDDYDVALLVRRTD